MKTIMIEGMQCGHCVAAVTKALQALGLQQVEVDLAGKCARVEDRLPDEVLKAAVEDLGFDVTEIK